VKKPQGEEAVVQYLMSTFKTKELEVLKKDIAKKVDKAIELIVTKGRESAMSEFN